MIPNWNEHCNVKTGTLTPKELREAVEVLLNLGTCFAVDACEQALHTTERGAVALHEAWEAR